jgi:hypothetical protein
LNLTLRDDDDGDDDCESPATRSWEGFRTICTTSHEIKIGLDLQTLLKEMTWIELQYYMKTIQQQRHHHDDNDPIIDKSVKQQYETILRNLQVTIIRTFDESSIDDDSTTGSSKQVIITTGGCQKVESPYVGRFHDRILEDDNAAPATVITTRMVLPTESSDDEDDRRRLLSLIVSMTG